MLRISAIALFCLLLLAVSVTLAVGGGIQQLAAIGRSTFACVVVFGPLLAIGALVGRIAEGECLRGE